MYIFDGWHDAVSPDSPPFASNDVDLLPCDISLDFPVRCAYHVCLVLRHLAQYFPVHIYFSILLAYAISIAPFGAREK